MLSDMSDCNCNCGYHEDRMYVQKTLERFEALHKEHDAKLAITQNKLEEEFDKDLHACFNKIRELEKRPWRMLAACVSIGAGFGTMLHYLILPIIDRVSK